MKRILYYSLMTAIALAVFSCTDEETISISDNGVNVTGSFSSGTARTAYTVGESSVSVTWEAGDQIGIISASDNTVYQYTAATSGSTTDFEPVGSKIENIDGETFYAWYPNNGNSSSNALLPNIYSQSYNKNGISSEYDFIYSKGEISNNELNLSFSHLFAFLKITIDPEYLDYMGLYISSSDDIAIRSGSYYDFTNDNIVGTTSKSLYYNISDEYLEGEDMITCYVAILPTSSSSDITIYNIHWLSSSSSVKIGDEIIQKISPANGFQAGHVYAITQNEEETDMYESTDYSQDGEVYTLQEHTKGNGIKFVILGEAYSDRLIADGTYKTHVDWAYDALFSEEPYATFKDYFDVYYVNVVSANEILGENTAFGVYYSTTNYIMSVYPSLVLNAISLLEETGYSYEDVVAIVLVRTSLSLRSICYFSNSFAVAYCEANKKTSLKHTVHHEALGHGFGKLGDEYVEYDAAYEGDLTYSHSINNFMNVDTNSDPDEVLWSYFLSDSRYDNEELGIFEGAATYAYGIYRPRYTSIMRYNTGGFNAPSRQEIYRRIMELSGEGYTFENFLEYDEVNRNSFVTGSAKLRNVEPEFTGVLGAPPIIIEDD